MSTPFYVAPEQVMKDRADYARKGISRGRALLASTYKDGIVIVAENPSTTLHKVSEVYDRIAFGGVGRYNEFDQLRIAGIRHADLKGYAYSRHDVDALSLANRYAQMLGHVFTNEMKPLEVEILVAEIGTEPEDDQMFHLLFDGTVFDRKESVVLGGDAEAVNQRIETDFKPRLELSKAISQARAALSGQDREIPLQDLEVAVLDRNLGRRSFARVDADRLAEMLNK